MLVLERTRRLSAFHNPPAYNDLARDGDNPSVRWYASRVRARGAREARVLVGWRATSSLSGRTVEARTLRELDAILAEGA